MSQRDPEEFLTEKQLKLILIGMCVVFALIVIAVCIW